jgi:hypothetical protein
MTALSVTTAHAFILTVSHGLLFRQPRYVRRHRRRRFCSPSLVTERHSITAHWLRGAILFPGEVTLNVAILSKTALVRGSAGGVATLSSWPRLIRIDAHRTGDNVSA